MGKTESFRTKSDKRVKKIAKITGARVVSNSGATPFAKGDLVTEDCVIEHKMTSKASFKLDKLVLEKVYKEAMKHGKEPMLIVDFGDIMLIGKIQKGL